jgi:MFS family permease
MSQPPASSGPAESRHVVRVYLLLLLLHTLAASLIWGINTLFLLDAGLSNAQAFAANAFFTAGLVLFEVPTGVLADTRGRRFSYLVGTVTLTLATVFYLVMWRASAAFWAWALASLFLGLGFTFFSGAVEAWLVDALRRPVSRARSIASLRKEKSSKGAPCSQDRLLAVISHRCRTWERRTSLARSC